MNKTEGRASYLNREELSMTPYEALAVLMKQLPDI